MKSLVLFIYIVLQLLLLFVVTEGKLLRHPPCWQHWLEEKSGHIHGLLETIMLQILPEEERATVRQKHANLTAWSQPFRDLCAKHRNITLVFHDTVDTFMSHFPHFSDHFYYFLSIHLWLAKENVFHISEYCEDVKLTFGIVQQHAVWRVFASKTTWIHELVSKLSDIVGYDLMIPIGNYLPNNTVFHQANSAPHFKPLEAHYGKQFMITVPSNHGRFLHAADGNAITAYLLHQTKFCTSDMRSQNVLSKSLNVSFINRKDSRGIENIAAVRSFFQHEAAALVKESSNNNITAILAVNEAYLEEHSFIKQLEVFHKADVLLTIHGAAETNFAFSLPCSIVIEVFPWMYFPQSYFAGLTKEMDLVHYLWQEPAPKELYFKPPSNCAGHLLQYHYDFLNFTDSFRSLNESSPLYIAFTKQQNLNCSAVIHCRQCARGVATVNVSIRHLHEHFAKAVKERETCLRQHPFYTLKPSEERRRFMI